MKIILKLIFLTFLHSIKAKVVPVKFNPLFNNKHVGFNLATLIYDVNVTYLMDVQKLIDSPTLATIKNFMYAKNESFSDLKLSINCKHHLINLMNDFDQMLHFNGSLDIFKPQFWSLNVLDSFGKMPEDILDGQFAWLGNYAECTLVKVPEFQGKHCLARFPTPGFPLGLVYGFCIPRACDDNDAVLLVEEGLTSISEKMTNYASNQTIEVFCKEGPVPIDAWTYFGMFILTIIALLMILGTLVDIYIRFVAPRLEEETNKISDTEPQTSSVIKKPIDAIEMSPVDAIDNSVSEQAVRPLIDAVPFQILKAFSVYTNSIELFDMTVPKNQLKTLDAMRVLSLGWVILGHTAIFKFLTMANKLRAKEKIPQVSFQIVLNGVLAVDTFFVMSGFLLCYIFLKIAAKPNFKINGQFIFKFYFHRFFRITPIYMLSLMISALFSPYMGSGPMYPIEGFEPDRCRTTWWKNILYINNFELGSHRLCFGHSWYLANDMQFHWVSLLMLIPLYKYIHRRVNLGVIITLAALCASLLATGLIIWTHPGYEMGIFSSAAPFEYLMNFYLKPWIRIPSFLVGVIGGFIMYQFKALKRTKLDWRLNIIGWIVSLTIIGYNTLSTSMDYNPNPPPVDYKIVFQTFYKPLWGFAICFIIFACNSDNGGIATKILSWRIWIVLSRLTFGAYLAHYSIIQYYVRQQSAPIYWTDGNYSWIFVGNVVWSFAVGAALSLCFELPFQKLEKFIL